MAAVWVAVVPPFHVADDAGQEVRFEPRLEAFVVLGERIVVVVVAAEDARLHVAVKARDEEADLGVPAFELRLKRLEGLPPRARGGGGLDLIADRHRAGDGAVRVRAARGVDEDVVARREIVVEARIDPAGQDFRAETEVVELVVELAVDRVVVGVDAENDIAIRHEIAHAEAVAGLVLMAVVVLVSRVEENDRIPWPPEGRDRVEVDASEIIGELPAEREAAGHGVEWAGDVYLRVFSGRPVEGLAGLVRTRRREGEKAEREGDGGCKRGAHMVYWLELRLQGGGRNCACFQHLCQASQTLIFIGLASRGSV